MESDDLLSNINYDIFQYVMFCRSQHKDLNDTTGNFPSHAIRAYYTPGQPSGLSSVPFPPQLSLN